jgi:hypothetical protein
METDSRSGRAQASRGGRAPFFEVLASGRPTAYSNRAAPVEPLESVLVRPGDLCRYTARRRTLNPTLTTGCPASRHNCGARYDPPQRR